MTTKQGQTFLNSAWMPASSLITILFFFLLPAEVTASNGMETVTLQLKYHHQFQFAGYYAAVEKGFYREAGLDVKLRANDPALKSPIKEVLSGAAQYGVADNTLAIERLAGNPVVVLANVFQKSPAVWIVRKDSGIRGPHDLVGKRVMHFPGLTSEMHAMLQVEGIPADRINWIPSSFNIQDLIDGHTDVFNGYTVNEPYNLREQGVAYRFINPRDYGIDFYGDVLFTSQTELDEHPERAKAFLQASLKGWQYAMDHPDEIINIIRKNYNSSKSQQHLKFEADAMRDLILPDLVTIGHINPGRWKVIAERFVALEIAEPNYHLLEGFIYDPNPKPKDLKTLYAATVSVALLALLFMGVSLWIGRLYSRLKKSGNKLRESQARLKAQFKAIPIPTYAWRKAGDDLVLVDYNDAVELSTQNEIAKSARMTAKEFFQHIPELPDELNRCLIEKANRSQEVDYTLSTTGEIRYMAFKYAFAPPDFVIVHAEDITDQRRAEDEKEKLQRELQHSQKMQSVGQLAGGIAHDFNNILSIILGYAGLAQSYANDTNQEKLIGYLAQVLTAGERGKELIQQMLTFSRKQSDELVQLHLIDLVDEDLKMLRSTMPSSIKIKSDLEAELPAVRLTHVMLNQILMNLFINASDAMDKKGTITVRLGMARKINEVCNVCHKSIEGDWVELSVSDTGNGIAPEVIERIFEPFYTTKEVGKGTGMGLAVVSGIMSNCGGHILVDSKTGIGTTFHLLFPPVNDGEQAPH